MITPPQSPTTPQDSEPSSGPATSDVSSERVVRFDNECVLIPESPSIKNKRPMILTKSYSLPLWKKRASTSNVALSDTELDEDVQVVLKVPVPRYIYFALGCR